MNKILFTEIFNTSSVALLIVIYYKIIKNTYELQNQIEDIKDIIENNKKISDMQLKQLQYQINDSKKDQKNLNNRVDNLYKN